MWRPYRGLLAALAGLVTAACAAAGPVATPAAGPVATSAVSTPPGEPGLPGAPLDLYPYAGAELAVVGVPAGDTLRARSGPGAEFAVVAELGPLTTGVPATGDNRSLPDGSWWSQVRLPAGAAWVNSRFVAQPGQTEDVTGRLGGPVRAGSMADLATAVVAARHLDRDGDEVTVVDGPGAGERPEIVVDVLGLADDAQQGERLHVLAARTADGFTARTVRATALCARGVDAKHACV